MNITAISNQGTSAASSQTPAAIPSGIDGLANEQTFLKLFVAQLKNQDPLNPQDGTQFVAQLATFSQLEQSLQMRQDLDALVKVIQTPPGSQSTATPAAGAPASH